MSDETNNIDNVVTFPRAENEPPTTAGSAPVISTELQAVTNAALAPLFDEMRSLRAELKTAMKRAERAEEQLAQYVHCIELVGQANRGESPFQGFVDALQRQQSPKSLRSRMLS